MNGVMKFFNRLKGYGFVVGEDGTTYFVHHTGIFDKRVLKREKDLEGAAVTFEPGSNDRGPLAVKVEVVLA